MHPRGTVAGMRNADDDGIPDAVLAAVSRSRSVASGVLAACSLDPDSAVGEIALVVTKGLADCETAMTDAGSATHPELLVLLAAEHHWMEAMLEMLESASSPEDALSLISMLSGSLRPG